MVKIKILDGEFNAMTVAELREHLLRFDQSAPVAATWESQLIPIEADIVKWACVSTDDVFGVMFDVD